MAFNSALRGATIAAAAILTSLLPTVASVLAENGTRPSPVENAECQVYNWEEMICTWDLNLDHQVMEYINVSVTWTPVFSPGHPDNGWMYYCPEQTMTSCFWDSEAFSYGSTYMVQVAVSYRDSGGRLREGSERFTVSTQYHVKPAPVDQLDGWTTNSTCIRLTWHLTGVSSLFQDKVFIAEVKVGVREQGWARTDMSLTTEPGADPSLHQSLVCDLSPHTVYSFRMAVRPAPIKGHDPNGYKSEWREVTVVTEESVPSTAPITCPGCFCDMPDVISRNSVHSRRVRVFWKDIPERARHGTLTHYHVTYTGLTSQRSHSLTLAARSRGIPVTSGDIELPFKKEDYHVTIAGATSKGKSPASSPIVVTALRKKPPAPHGFQVTRSRQDQEARHFHLTWEPLVADVPDVGHTATPGQRQTSVMTGLFVAWCRGHRERWACQGELQWARLPPEEKSYHLTTSLADQEPGDLLLGVSVQVSRGQEVLTSGILWNECVYIRNQVPQTSPRNVRVSPTPPPSPDGLELLWERPKCHRETTLLNGYLVTYCPTDNGTSCVVDEEYKVKVSTGETKATLNGLAVRTEYLVHVRYVSSAGLGPPSNPIVCSVDRLLQETDDETGLIVATVAIPSVLVLVALCICGVRHCRKERRKVPKFSGLLGSHPGQKKARARKHGAGSLRKARPDAFNIRHVCDSDGCKVCMTNPKHDRHLKTNKSLESEDQSTSIEVTINSNVPLIGRQHGNSSNNNGHAAKLTTDRPGQPRQCERGRPEKDGRDTPISASVGIPGPGRDTLAESYLLLGAVDTEEAGPVYTAREESNGDAEVPCRPDGDLESRSSGGSTGSYHVVGMQASERHGEISHGSLFGEIPGRALPPEKPSRAPKWGFPRMTLYGDISGRRPVEETKDGRLNRGVSEQKIDGKVPKQPDSLTLPSPYVHCTNTGVIDLTEKATFPSADQRFTRQTISLFPALLSEETTAVPASLNRDGASKEMIHQFVQAQT